jgi:hypothetical protein
MSGGKNQGQKISTYYVGMHMVLCSAPIDFIGFVRAKEKIINTAPIVGTSDVFIDQSEIFGGLKREGGIKGLISFLFGYPDQLPNPYLTSKLGLVPAYRGVVSVILNKIYIGTGYYMQNWSFFATRVNVREKGQTQWHPAYACPQLPIDLTYSFTYTGSQDRPELFGLTTAQVKTGYYVIKGTNVWAVLDDSKLNQASGFSFAPIVSSMGLINAVHVIRECITDSEWGIGEPEENIDAASFEFAAETCYLEGLGFSWLWDKTKPINDFISEVANHINAVVYRDRKTNKWKITLIRKVENLSTLPVVTSAHVQKISKLSRKQLHDLTSQYLLKYESNITFKEASVRVSDPSLASRQGKEVLTSATFSGIATPGVAQVIAERELMILSAPIYSGSLVGDRTLADLNPGDAFILKAFDALESDLVLRVVSIDLGTILKEPITIEFTEDAFAATAGVLSLETGTKWTPTDTTPTPVIYRKIFESPYYVQALEKGDANAQAISPLISFIRATAVSPSGIAISSELWDTASTIYSLKNEIDFQFSGVLTTDITKLTTILPVGGLIDEVNLTIESFLYLEEELLYVDDFDLTMNTITVKRGVLDTVPKIHLTGSRFIAIASIHSSDPTEFVVGETVSAKLLTQTSDSLLTLAEAPVDSVDLIGRMHLPYPPGNFQLNGVSWASDAGDSGNMLFTWASRNRFQQTTLTVLDYYAGSVTSEPNVTYTLDLLLDSDDSILYSYTGTALLREVTISDLPANLVYPAIVRAELISQNANGKCFQAVVNVFTLPQPVFKAEDNVTYFSDEDGTTLFGI